MAIILVLWPSEWGVQVKAESQGNPVESLIVKPIRELKTMDYQVTAAQDTWINIHSLGREVYTFMVHAEELWLISSLWMPKTANPSLKMVLSKLAPCKP